MSFFRGKTPEQKASEEAEKASIKAREAQEKQAREAALTKQKEVEEERKRRVEKAEGAIRDYYIGQAPKWEYYRIHTFERDNHGWFKYKNKELSVNEIHSIMAELGGLGWELVATMPWITTTSHTITYTTGFDLFFKRPMPKLPDELANALDAAQKFSG